MLENRMRVFIHLYKTISSTNITFQFVPLKNLNFSTKGGTSHSFFSFFCPLVILLKYSPICVWRWEVALAKKHGWKNEDNKKFRFIIGSQLGHIKVKQEEREREKMVITLSSKCKIIFAEMDKFQRWIVGRDV